MMDSHLILKQMHPVGRLDADTTGLLLFSREGKLTQTLLNPSTKIDREYEALVEGKVNLLSLKEKLAQGVVTSDGTFPAVLLESFTFDHPEVMQPCNILYLLLSHEFFTLYFKRIAAIYKRLSNS